ncbi:sucrose-6-phosphate hydrolase [Enterococcus plantarum]|uniref:sucrose-6-phosphate hydrolase n=1 Tax=Enterococcus plantarum TaxID=1077675 RepID=UPI001A8DC2A3|nr:sucrose-6-phosphate hydrolase [Enterococcus plantarum]MBO0468173.1 sucrose-6-phosphate hydrolase [Enterococcus plantarum]
MSEKKVWSREKRYQPYEEWGTEHLASLKQKIDASTWRLGYHIQPATGLLNDPNGFSFFNDQWHVFYQSYPMGPVHGIKSWYHMTSDNLVDWNEEGTKVFPDSLYDSHGVYSGTALPISDQLFLAYTGNVRDDDWIRHSYQLGAWMDQSGSIKKIEQPLIAAPPAGYTSEFRDPQVFRYKSGYLMTIGAQDETEKGKILTYQSSDLLSWQCIGELGFTDRDMGFMIECPNLLLTDEFALLIFCPQGLDSDVCNYQNIYPNMYVIGDSYQSESNCLTNPSSLKNLDEGFDVYATQAFKAPDERLLSISWIGLPEIEYPTDQEEWAHCLSIVKELIVKDKKLYQRPVEEMKQLRLDEGILFDNSKDSYHETATNHYELALSFNSLATGTLTLYADKEQNQGLTIHFDSQRGKMTIDRSHAGVLFGEDYGVVRSFSIEQKPLKLQIFVDSSVVELFINDGEKVATMRVFPEKGHAGFHLTCDGDYQGQFWQLRKTNQ